MHYRQRFNWDCGISCIVMVLPKVERIILLKDLYTICKQEEFYKSTWTIDLCYLLHRFKVDHVFYTVTLGIHPEHKGKHFYEKIVSKDEERVNRKFCEAKKRGISVVKGSLTITELLQHLSKYGPIIILIDAILLKCNTCKVNRLSHELQKCLPRISSYHGHYIVLCGYNRDLGVVLYRNPAVGDSKWSPECILFFFYVSLYITGVDKHFLWIDAYNSNYNSLVFYSTAYLCKESIKLPNFTF
ncbi:hypothetical protein AAG570_012699 [Ranatra chinensis]|uniref:Protein GUCD1 n=1 Tax=Ranatra chinensis TaxID=642074 RepID=A0ABD0YEL4_9HEMI